MKASTVSVTTVELTGAILATEKRLLNVCSELVTTEVSPE